MLYISATSREEEGHNVACFFALGRLGLYLDEAFIRRVTCLDITTGTGNFTNQYLRRKLRKIHPSYIVHSVLFL